MRTNCVCCLGWTAACIVLALLGQPSWAGPKVEVGRPCSEPNRPSLTEVDHKTFNDLLQK